MNKKYYPIKNRNNKVNKHVSGHSTRPFQVLSNDMHKQKGQHAIGRTRIVMTEILPDGTRREFRRDDISMNGTKNSRLEFNLNKYKK